MNTNATKDLAPVDDPNEKPYPGYARERAALEAKAAAADRAQSATLPGPLREAFADGTRKVGQYTLLPVTLGLTAILAQIDSPLLGAFRIVREEMSKPVADKETPPTREQRLARADDRILSEVQGDDVAAVATIFCFLHPPARLRQLLAVGRQHLLNVAMDELGDKLHPLTLAELQQACALHYADSFSTIVQYRAKQESSGEQVFFSQPLAATMTTVSAGGSSSSAS